MFSDPRLLSLRSHLSDAFTAFVPVPDRSVTGLNVWQCIVLALGGLLLMLEALYVPIRMFHHAGGRLVLVVDSIRYEWLAKIPANAKLQTDLITWEIMVTLLVTTVAFWALKTRYKLDVIPETSPKP